MSKLLLVLVVLMIPMLGGCDLMRHTSCDDKVLVQEKSPDGKYVAILYHRSCANNSGLYTCVNIQEVSNKVIAKPESQPILTIRGFHDISAIWSGPNNLELKTSGLTKQADILTQENGWKEILISYKE